MNDTLELLHQLDKRIDRTIETMGNLERENIELKATISKMEITTSELKAENEKLSKMLEYMLSDLYGYMFHENYTELEKAEWAKQYLSELENVGRK